MTSRKERLVRAMQQLAERLEREVPEAKPVFDRVRDGKLSPEDGLSLLSQMLVGMVPEDPNAPMPDILERMQVALDPRQALPEPSDTDVENALEKVSEPSKEALAQMGMTVEGLFYRDETDGKIKLNPMYQVAVMERLQFDGDVPELRMGGDLPRGQMAAVPVENEGTSPVALGAKLARASEEVTKEIEDLRTDREEAADMALAEAAAASMGGTPETVALAQVEARGALVELHKPLDVPGYERGKKAAMRKVEDPTGADLAAIPEEKKREFAFKAVSTTQGRRSSVAAIARRVTEALERDGYKPVVRDSWSGRTSLANADWTMTLNIGPDDTSPNFSPIMAASSSIGAKLVKTLRESSVATDTEIEVEVAPVNDYGERVVGWKAQIVLAHERARLEAP